jgi:A/G-specific adenine glycosylase
MEEPSPDDVRARLLPWYDANQRDLPWRRTLDPYRILVAEYLLQRTRIKNGTPYYERFLDRFPTVRDLAAAPLDDVLAIWEGLGFYGRARNLHAAARAIVEAHRGQVPSSYDALASLPGIGPYTAGAVASIAFGVPVPAVDGNVTRVIARLFRIRADVTTGTVRRRIGEIAARLVSPDRPGAFNQAMMELGATVCTPVAPGCVECPIERICLARAAGEERDLPVSSRPRSPPVVPVVFGLVTANGRVLVVRRPRGQLLGGLWALPGGERSGRLEKADLKGSIRSQAGLDVRVGPRWTRVDRTFSHRKWVGSIYRCTPIRRPKETESVRWIPREEALRLPLVPFHRDAIKALAGVESFEAPNNIHKTE